MTSIELFYIPWKDNIVADIQSQTPYELKLKITKTHYLPGVIDKFMEIKTPGGGDSLFQSLSYFLHGNFEPTHSDP